MSENTAQSDPGADGETDRLSEIMDGHEHRQSRMVVQSVPNDREVLTCHECQGPIAENRHNGSGWFRL